MKSLRKPSVSPSSAVHDPERVVDRTILADIKPFVEELQFAPAPTEWGASWRESDALARLAIESRLDAVEGVNEPLIARTVARHLPAGSMLVVSSSMPVRDVEWFAPVVVPEVVANRGANGIDGVVSTAVGVALARATPVSALVGDIAFVHDSNALLGLKARDVDIRVVVVDNDGGGIFSFLPQAESTELATFEKLWGTPHGVDLSQLVAAHGIRFCECSTVAELSVALAQRGPIVIRVRTDRHQNVAVHDALNRAVADVIGEGAL
jgi:2-succinyl-5-enolpyruvyl-6-hydroxy-3-cyclohexene-1-carboxylate synthase